jgi:hypothetical protein
MLSSLARITVVSLVLGCTAATAHAGAYADDLGKCLVKSTSTTDRYTLMKWLFAVLAANPQVQSMANISTEQRDEIDRTVAALFQRLLTESCRNETQQAIKYEGPIVIQQSFQMFGQASMIELSSAPSVRAAMTSFNKYVDEQKIKALFPPGTAK